MIKIYKLMAQLCLVTISTSSLAVQVNPKGLGEVLIYPYYTVNNDLNTLYSVVNTTQDTKVLVVRFLEGDNGMEVLTFNIYLSAFDVWTGVLVPTVSNMGGHYDEPSVVHISTDTSCAPYLNKAGQEFLPYIIDTDLDFDNLSLERAREGHIEIIEAATFIGSTAVAADHGYSGVPANCAAIQADWEDDGLYNSNNDEQAPTGGLLGSGSLINVAEGLAFPFDAIALQNFWQGSGMHTEPGSTEPDLAAAFPQSSVLLDKGELATSKWQHGFQAVSAVLTKAQIINEYALETILDSKTEWVLNFPTKRFHTNTADDAVAPFSSVWDGAYACEAVKTNLWDREAKLQPPGVCGDPCAPFPVYPSLCQLTNVMEYNLPGDQFFDKSQVLGSDNLLTITSLVGAATESGWVKLEFPESLSTSPKEGFGFNGLPVVGFAVQQYTNAGASEGLLAQYGSLFKHKGLMVVDEGVGD